MSLLQLHQSNMTYSRTWGLYIQKSSVAIPLKSLDISIDILNNIARVFYTQVYYNDSNALFATEFFFPISTNACFDSFEAQFKDTVIKGVIKEKKEAKQPYQEALTQGRTVAYSEIDEETGDVMKVLIGNIPPKSTISVKYSYIQKLETTLNKFWCFQLFSSITPRYNGDLNALLKTDISLLSNYPTISSNDLGAYPWNITVDIQSSSPITFLKCPLYDIVSEYGNEKHTCKITLDPSYKHYPNKDFILLYSNESDKTMNYFLTPFEDGYCAMINFHADFENSSGKETYENFVKAKETSNSHAMNTINGEYIFFLDRSGSMSGEKIEMAKNSLLLFLKSLPGKSYFNVVSFGSNYHQLFESSVLSSQESVESVIRTISTFKADLGGTQLYHPLKSIFELPLKKNYPRFLFLLTDGEVENTQQVLNLIKSYSDIARVFTIGIGKGCSRELITKATAYGKGKHEFVFENAVIIEKVINLLNSSLSPCFSDLSLQMDNFDGFVFSVTPNPTSVHFLLNGQTVTFFLFLREATFQDFQRKTIRLRFYDSRIDGYRIIEGVLDLDQAFKNELIPKLAIFEMIKALEDQKKQLSHFEKRIIWLNQADIDKTLLELSLKYGVLCKETAFFCDIAENNQFIKSFQPLKVTVPSISNEIKPNAHIHTVPGGFGGGLFGNSGRQSYRSLTSSNLSPSSNSFSSSIPNDINSFQPRGFANSNYSSNQASGLFSGGFPQNQSTSLFGHGGYAPQFQHSSSLGDGSNYQNLNLTMGNVSGSPNKEKLQARNPIESNKKIMESRRLYLDVAMKQKFQGNWDPNDSQLCQIIFKDGKLPQIPKDVQMNTNISTNEVWVTLLVLLWLELICQTDRKAWSLVHQKGCEWLKGHGIDYDQVKSVGISFVQ